MKIDFLTVHSISKIHQTDKNFSKTNTKSSKISFTGDSFNYEEELAKKINNLSWLDKHFGNGVQNAKKAILERLIGAKLSQDSVIREKEATIAAKEEALRFMKEALAAKEKEVKLLERQLLDARRNSQQSETINKLNEEITKLTTENKTLKNEFKTELNRYNKTIEEQAALAKREQGKGWDRFVGHELLKKQLQEIFINKIPQEKNYPEGNHFPNGILFYGQHGTGKTFLFRAFAEQANCEPEEIDMTQEPDDIIYELSKKLKVAKNKFEKEGKRTLILLDDFNAIAELSENEKDAIKENGNEEFSVTNVGQLSRYLDSAANKYKTTIVMTTNHPANIHSEILSSNRVPYKIFIGPPNMQDTAALFKFYLEGNQNIDAENIDYLELAEEAAKAIKNDTAYSAQGILNIINKCNDEAKNKNTKITQYDILQTMNAIGPDISKEGFQKFLNDLQYLIKDDAN